MTAYPFKVALSGIWREKWINLLCTLTIATGLFLITLAFLFVHNIDLATKRLPERFSITVFLKDGLSPSGVRSVLGAVEQSPGVKHVRYISKEEALKELRDTMKDADYILEGLEENPLPASFELRLKRDSVTWESVKGLAEGLENISGVAEVQYGGKFLSALQAIKRNVAVLSFILIGALSAGIVFVCYSTVKILFYRKKDEIETLKFLGATKWFIRAPFLIEGGALGLAAGAVSTAGTLSLYYLVYHRLGDSLALMKALSIPDELLLYTPLTGLFAGVLGALAALGRIRF